MLGGIASTSQSSLHDLLPWERNSTNEQARAAILHVFTIGYAAQMLELDEELLWDLWDESEPDDRVFWAYDINNGQNRAITLAGIEMFREIIEDQIDKTDLNLSGA